MKNIFDKIRYYIETKRLFKDLDLENTNFVILDTETTGLDIKKNEKIISLACLKIKNLQIQQNQVLNFFINPKIKIPDYSTKIHNITDDDVKDQPELFSKADQILSFIKKNILVGHNIKFDIDFIKKDAKGTNLENRMKIIKSIDTINLTAALYPDLNNYELSYLCQKFNLKHDDQLRHSALGDCWLTGRLFLYLVNKAKNQGIKNVDQLIKFCNQGKDIKRFSNVH